MVIFLTQRQIAAFGDGAVHQWSAATASDLFQAFPDYYAAMGASGGSLKLMVYSVAKWAQRYEIQSKADVTRLCYVATALGHRFWQDPRFQTYVNTAMSTEVPCSRRAQSMVTSTKAWLGMLWSEDDIGGFSTRLAAFIQSDQALHVSHIPSLLPGYWRIFSATDHSNLLAWIQETAPVELRKTNHKAAAYSACAMVHGVQWLQDPQYPRLAEAVQAYADPDQLATALSEIYTEALS